MRLLVLSDLHGIGVRIEALLRKYDPDCIILSGDIPTAIDFPVLLYSLLTGGNRQTYVRNIYKRFFERLSFKQIKSAKHILTNLVRYQIPIIAIHGNTETADTRRWLSLFSHRYENLHWISDGFVKIQDTLFVGHGWTEYVPSQKRERTPGDVLYDTAIKILLDTYGRAKQRSKQTVLVSHDPPYGTSLDFLEHKQIHAGSRAVREMMNSGYFDLVISGHLHESYGIHLDESGWIGINAGAAVEDLGCVYDTDSKELEWITNFTSRIGLTPLIYRNRIQINYDQQGSILKQN